MSLLFTSRRAKDRAVRMIVRDGRLCSGAYTVGRHRCPISILAGWRTIAQVNLNHPGKLDDFFVDPEPNEIEDFVRMYDHGCMARFFTETRRPQIFIDVALDLISQIPVAVEDR